MHYNFTETLDYVITIINNKIVVHYTMVLFVNCYRVLNGKLKLYNC